MNKLIAIATAFGVMVGAVGAIELPQLLNTQPGDVMVSQYCFRPRVLQQTVTVDDGGTELQTYLAWQAEVDGQPMGSDGKLKPSVHDETIVDGGESGLMLQLIDAAKPRLLSHAQ